MIPRCLITYSACVALAASASAGEFVVTNLNDDGPGSLRDAVNQANSSDDSDTIMFDFSGLPGGGQRVINLTSGGLVLEKSVNILGLGPKELVVERSSQFGTPEFRVFEVSFGDKEVMISGMTIRNGHGGAIRGGGALATNGGNKVQLHDAVLENNTSVASGDSMGGGAVFNGGELTITASQLKGNSVTMPTEDKVAGGGAVFNAGKLTIDKSVFSDNTATDGTGQEFHYGGAIFNSDGATLTITNSSFDDNQVSALGGAIFNNVGGTMRLNNNTVSGNGALDGGGVMNLGTIEELNSNIISGNMNNPLAGGMFPDLGLGAVNGSINSASGNIVGHTNGHSLNPATNQLGVNPNLTPLENNGGPTPSRRPDPADGPTKDQGDDSLGLRFDQRGFFRNVGDGTDVGAVETGNRVFLAASGDWFDPANWAAGNVPGGGDPAWIVGGNTIDLTGSGPINVDSINVGVSGDVGSANGTVIGSDSTVTSDSIDVGSAYGEQSPINSGNGTVSLTNATISTNNLLVGVSEPSGEGVYTTAHGEVTLTSNIGGTSTLSVTGNAGVGSAVALAPDSKAGAHGALEFDGQSAVFGALIAGEALSTNGGRTATSSQVTITAGDNVTTGSLSAGTALAFGDSSSSSVDARVDITANDVFAVNGPANVGQAQISGAAADAASAEVANVWYSVTANQHTVNGGLRVAQVSTSAFGTPGGDDVPTAHVGMVRADINVQTLNVLNNLEVASLFATGPSNNSIDDASVTITGSDTEVTGVVAVGTMFLSDSASGVTGNAMLDVQGGSFTVTNTPPGFPSLRVGTVDRFTAGPELAQLLAAARFQGVTVELAGGVAVGVTNVTGADPASSVRATLELAGSQMTVGVDVSLAEQDGAATIDSTVAIVQLNRSLLAIGGELQMGERAVLDYTVEGLTRPAPGSSGEYGAIDAAGAMLDGQLALSFDYPGVAEGDMFELIRLTPGGMFTGFFDDTTVTGLPAGLTAEAAIMGTSLFATVIAVAGIPGDYNNDGKVDAADYVVWRKNPDAFGGDPAGYNTWRANFGRTAAGSGTTSFASAEVPEPRTISLLVVVVCMSVFTQSGLVGRYSCEHGRPNMLT